MALAASCRARRWAAGGEEHEGKPQGRTARGKGVAPCDDTPLLPRSKTQLLELGIGLCVTDPHRNLNAAGITIALD
jgi:hypothetical protein